MIARLEADEPTKILDRFVDRHRTEIEARDPPTQFDANQVFDEAQLAVIGLASDRGIARVPRSPPEACPHQASGATPLPRA